MHMWEDKGAEMLRVIQLNTLEDRSVHDKFQWDSAINFLQSSLQEKLEISEANLRYLLYQHWFAKNYRISLKDVHFLNNVPPLNSVPFFE